MNERFVDVGGTELWCETRGRPFDPPIVLVMGAQASAMRWPEPVLDGLVARGLYVVRFDQRDTGRSSSFDFETSPYTLSDLAADVAGLMDALGTSSAHVLGVSMGGMVAQTLAIEHPQRLRSLTIVNSTPSGVDAPNGIGRNAPDALPPPAHRVLEATMAQLRPPKTRADAIAAVVSTYRVLAGSRFPFDEETQRAIATTEYDRARDFAKRDNHARVLGKTGDRRSALAKLRVPTLVLHGQEDPMLPLAHGMATADAIPDARLVVYEGVGHEMPAPLRDEMLDAVAEHVGAAEGS